MTHRLKVHYLEDTKTVTIPTGTRLIDALRENGFDIAAPCGGNGTCGKCRVLLPDEGFVTACIYHISKDLEVILPEPRESKILTTQYQYSRVMPLAPGDAANRSHYPFGVAVDIGTTTMALYLVQLITGALVETRTVINPQSAYGADIISRINYCVQNNDGTALLQQGLITTINEQLDDLATRQGITVNDMIKLTFSGNTTMLHLLLGENPRSLAFVPFTPVFTSEQVRKGSDLDLHCHPDAEIRILPSLTAYIGADIIAGIASLSPPEHHRYYLYVDIGTNGEMALVTPEKIFCCATAAGPAFEGANISCGMGALQGAISSYLPGEGYRTIADLPPAGICGSGLIDIIAGMLHEGMLQPDGFLENDHVVVEPGLSGTGNAIVITPADIREVQLAKSAISAGMKTMISAAGLDFEEIDAIYLAGGFGNYIRTASAVAIGLLPETLSEKVIPVGNASGTGATLALQSVFFYKEMEAVLDRMHYIELSDNDTFNLEFAMNMSLDSMG